MSDSAHTSTHGNVSVSTTYAPISRGGLSLTYQPFEMPTHHVVYRRFVYRRWTIALLYSQNSHVQQLLLKLGKRVRALRLDQGWTQEELAHRSGLNRSYMSEVERGRSDVSLSTLQKIARSLGISLAELFTGIG
jgi:DNA-binding XRE family transcriptional regulator